MGLVRRSLVNTGVMRLLIVLLMLLFACQNTTPTPEASPSPTDPIIGQAAPTPAARDQDGQVVDLGELYRKGPVLLFFYPKAGTPGCTKQVCSLRDAYETLQEAGLTVLGVSTDSSESQKAFQKAQRLPYSLLADPDGEILQAFDVSSTVGLANREAFLIRDGVVVWHDGSASTDRQAEDVLAVIKTWESVK